MKTKSERALETLLVLAGGLIVLYWIYNKKIFLFTSILLILVGVLSPWLSQKISWLWLKFSEILGMIIPKVILVLLFFVFLLPLSVLYRLFKKDPLRLKRKNNSCFNERNHSYTAKDMENMW
jgi:hypothetical protein